MYSPRISEDLVSALYHTAKAMRMPMTKLVDKLIRKALAAEVIPHAVKEASADYAATDQAVA